MKTRGILRLAEMVQHITECAPAGALHAVQRAVVHMPRNADESLAAVATAIVAVRRGIDLTDEIRLD